MGKGHKMGDFRIRGYWMEGCVMGGYKLKCYVTENCVTKGDGIEGDVIE